MMIWPIDSMEIKSVMKNHALITGGGFIGSSLAQHFIKRMDVTIVDDNLLVLETIFHLILTLLMPIYRMRDGQINCLLQ